MPEINDYNKVFSPLRENKVSSQAHFSFRQKVGQDSLFTRRRSSTITPSYDRHTFWFLSAVTLSFFIAQSLLILFGR